MREGRQRRSLSFHNPIPEFPGGILAWAAGGCAAIVAVVMITAAFWPPLDMVRIELAAADSGSTFQIFFDVGRGFNETDSASLIYPRARQGLTLYLPKPPGVLRQFRLDPLAKPGEIRIASIAIGHRPFLGIGGMLIARKWSGQELRSAFSRLNQVVILDTADGSLAVRSTGHDPFLESNPGLSGLDGAVLTRVRAGLQDILIALMVWLVLLASIALLARQAMRHQALLVSVAGIKPEVVFVALALSFGAYGVCVTPPLQFPDEQIHLFRSYQVSRLDLFKPRNLIPADLWRFYQRYQRLIGEPENQTSFAEIAAELQAHVDPSKIFQHSTTNLVLAYLPQAAGVLAGRLTSSSPLVMMFFGRLFNLIAYVLLVAAAIRIAPVFKWTLLALALMPMSVFIAASLSYDASTIGLAFLFTALVLRHSRNTEALVGNRSLMALFLTAWGLALMKPPYFLLTFTFLLLPVKSLGSRRRYWLVFAALVCSPLLVSLVWFATRAVLLSLGLIVGYPLRIVNSAAEAQFLSMLQAPWDYARIYLSAVRRSDWYWVDTMIGSSLGWLDTPLPEWVVKVQRWFLPAVALVDADEAFTLNRWRRALLVGLFLGFLFLIPTLLYIFDYRENPLSAAILKGVQGRYFIPIAPLALLAISSRFFAVKNIPLRGVLRLAILAVVFCSLTAEAVAVYRRFYVN